MFIMYLKHNKLLMKYCHYYCNYYYSSIEMNSVLGLFSGAMAL